MHYIKMGNNVKDFQGYLYSSKNYLLAHLRKYANSIGQAVPKCHSEALAEESQICNIQYLLDSSLRSE